MLSLFRRTEILKRCATLYMKENSDISEVWPVLQSYVPVLCASPGISQEEISKRLIIEKSSVTRHLAKLENMGYVERRQSENDKRIMLVYPTKKVYEDRDKIRNSILAWDDFMLRDLTEDEKKEFLRLSDKVMARAYSYLEKEKYLLTREEFNEK